MYAAARLASLTLLAALTVLAAWGAATATAATATTLFTFPEQNGRLLSNWNVAAGLYGSALRYD